MVTVSGTGDHEFRRDINGLRAWAVVAVVLYHFMVPGISGGYAGVDVFFVISGYLMCGIIYKGVKQKKFSIGGFYLARARRIFPALIFLCITCLVFGWFLLMPEEYQLLGKHVRESLTFTSNLKYLKESGYFDIAAQEKWLLHTWSLSVEWQFYLIFPLFIVGAARLFGAHRSLLPVLLSFFFISFLWCVWVTEQQPAAGFYTLQSRAWEMLAGALVFAAKERGFSVRNSRVLEWAGFALIVAAFVIFQKQTLWPGWRATLPVAGSMLVLLANRPSSYLTGSDVAQWLGSRSYSIYLWHWPLVVALTYAGALSEWYWVISAIVLSLILGHVSYVCVEVPAQKRLVSFSKKVSVTVVLASLITTAALAQIVRDSGFPNRLPPEVAVIEAERQNHNPRMYECLNAEAYCIYGDEGKSLRAIVMGDSHADAAVTAVVEALPDDGGSVLFRGGSGCLIVFGMKFTNDLSHCNALNERLYEEHSELTLGVPVIIFGRTSEFVNAGQLSAEERPKFFFEQYQSEFTVELLQEFSTQYVNTLCSLAEYRPVYVVRPIPEMPVDVPTMVGRGVLFGEMRNPALPLADYQRRHAFVMELQDDAAKRCGIKILDPRPYLCDGENCYGGYEGRPLYRDEDHLSEFGNRLLVPLFVQLFNETLVGQ